MSDSSGNVKADKIKQSKRKRREIHAALTPIEWGDYNIDFAISDSEGAKEISGFIQDLDAEAQFAKTRACVVNELDLAAPSKSNLDLLQLLITQPALPQDEVTLVESSDDLQRHLSQAFRLPLLHRTTDARPSIIPHQLNLAEFLRHMSDDKDAGISVYDYSIADAEDRTYSTSVANLCSSFPSRPNAPALNFLDIQNRTGFHFCPLAVKLHDLVFRTAARSRGDKGKTASSWTPPDSPEFFLASMQNAISSIHIDSGGGNTWIAILEGKKIWYFPRFADDQSVLQLAAAGSLAPEHYPHGWVKVELRAGDVLIMPPGLPHAVFTPEDCLSVGGQFYTAPNLGKSLRTLDLQERNPGISNEDLSSSAYATLTFLLKNGCALLKPTDKMSVAANPLTLDSSSSTPKISAKEVKAQLTARGIEFDKKAKLPDLLASLLQHYRDGDDSTPGSVDIQRQLFLQSLGTAVSAIQQGS
ncbi:hypothetical protein BFW01_g1695 [Lasiodiplodia theobromae]|nr:hypothetical protein BFW01_g1695 [Lasiodiplodia theobromae]